MKVYEYLPVFQLSLIYVPENPKKALWKKKETLDILKTSCKIFSMKFLEVNNLLRNYLQYFVKEVQSNSDCLEQICVSS